MKKAKILIGANFGDEGKGFMTDYFAHQAMNNREGVLVIKHNGGAQAGHTVETGEKRFIFHHVGSGTALNAPTYLAPTFIVNPILYAKEYKELSTMGYKPVVYVNEDCAVTTPYEMMLNHALETHRKGAKHGSCGVGIFETFNREKSFHVAIKDLKSPRETILIVNKCYELASKRAAELGISDLFNEQITNIDEINQRFCEDVAFFYSYTKIVDDALPEVYKTIIFEGGQGLQLDQNNMELFPHLTPSNTGIKNPADYLCEKGTDREVEAVYITRTYVTKHGAGPLADECRKEDINADMFDVTNVTNKYQDHLRYAPLNNEELVRRIKKDFFPFYETFSGEKPMLSIALTHMNEFDFNINELGDEFDVIYTSDGRQRDSVAVHRNK